ncbi:hypothetical protein HOY82DRAFT_602998 [Tuber indicum]|nr:hypothetical protein HOY82DRAFT_602998 [Tuber indicum]
MVPHLRRQRFHRWVSWLSIPSFVKKALGIIPPPPPPPAAAAAKDNLSAIPVNEIPIPDSILLPS